MYICRQVRPLIMKLKPNIHIAFFREEEEEKEKKQKSQRKGNEETNKWGKNRLKSKHVYFINKNANLFSCVLLMLNAKTSDAL